MSLSITNSIINFVLNLKTNKSYEELERACADPKEASANTLRRILTDSKDTEYGIEHHFAEILKSETADELFAGYAKNVPVNSYDDLEPYINIMKHGGTNVLIPDKPVIYLTTSGTTGEPKYLPYNQRTLDINREILHMVLSGYAHINHSVFKGKVLAITSQAVEGTAPDGTPTGSTSGITRNSGGAMQKLLALPVCVFDIKDYQSRYYVIMRIAIEQDVSLMMTANPSSVLELQKTVDENFDVFCDEIESGTLSEALKLTDEVRKELMKVIKPNPRRAQELRRIKSSVADNRPLPMDYWPHLRILSTWKCGNTGFYAEKFKGWFPLQCQHIEIGYFASECRFGMVLRGSDTTVPFPHKHFFEFVAEEDFDEKEPRLYLLHELKPGKRYCPVITTANGLYRYNMNDMVECGPRYMNTPTISMVQKINGIVSMTGEKLHERQFINAVEATVKSLNQPVQFFMGFANLAESRYDFYMEFINELTDAEREQFNLELDHNLQKLNVEYESKRKSLRLNTPCIHSLPTNAYESLKERLLAKGRRDGQFKLALLVQNDELHEEIKKLEIKT